MFGGHPFGVSVGELMLVRTLFAMAAVQFGEFGPGRLFGRAAAESEDRVGECGHLAAGSVALTPQFVEVGVHG